MAFIKRDGVEVAVGALVNHVQYAAERGRLGRGSKSCVQCSYQSSQAWSYVFDPDLKLANGQAHQVQTIERGKGCLPAVPLLVLT
jgi:hypothetical protein